MAVEHRRVRFPAEFVPLAMHAEPLLGVGLVVADLLAHLRVEDLRAAARERTEPGRFHLREQLSGWPLREPLEPVPLDRSPRLQVQVRARAMDILDDAEIPLIWQLVVEAANNVKFGAALLRRLAGTVQNLLVAHHVT